VLHTWTTSSRTTYTASYIYIHSPSSSRREGRKEEWVYGGWKGGMDQGRARLVSCDDTRSGGGGGKGGSRVFGLEWRFGVEDVNTWW